VGIFKSPSSFSSARFAGWCGGHKGTVFPRERGGFVAGNTALFFPAQEPSEMSPGVIEEPGTCLKGRKQKRLVYIGKKMKEFGDFFWLKAAAVFPR